MKSLNFKYAVWACWIFLCPGFLLAQTQTLKGRVIDKAIKVELIGATVRIIPADHPDAAPQGAATDASGFFRIPELPIGKYHVWVSYLGYRDAVLQNIVLDAGKETDLQIELEEMVLTQKEVVVSARIDKEKPLNEFSTVSARTFSVEETRRFAAAVNDPARMATSFAGVVAGNDGNNIIIIRGNNPNGMLWRMEGVDIPNPNHFSAVGTSGGGISILSSQLLTNSDFITGAFSAEYGNALSGVFDLKLRKGNSDKREFTLQLGVLGLDAAAEGPIGTGANRGSYLVNYRYSTLSLISKMGVNIGNAVTNFQDLSFNIWKPAGKLGTFTLFGLGGLSTQTVKGVADSTQWADDFQQRFPSTYLANTGVLGLTHGLTWGSRTFLKTSAVLSGTENGFHYDEYLLPDYQLRREYNTGQLQTKGTISSVLSHKFNPKHYLRTGVYLNRLQFKLQQGRYNDLNEAYQQELQKTGSAETVNAFIQWQYRPLQKLTFNIGCHSMAMLLNNKWSFEPRAALRYTVSSRHALSLGYGLHTQVMPLGLYFLKDQNGVELNPELDLSKAHHLVAGYDFSINKNLRLKTEVYYQHLFDVPVESGKASSFSQLNEVEGLSFRKLENTGKGRNYGLELTAEQFLNKGFYFLASLSLFRSEYQGSDEIWRKTRFDSRYSGTFTAGKEWSWNKKDKNRSVGFNIKVVTAGGQRFTPIDLAASIEQNETIYDESRAFTEKLNDYFRLDTGFKLKRNYKQLTTTLSLDIQNTTNRQNVGGAFFNPDSLKIETWYQAPLIPVLAYRLEF